MNFLLSIATSTEELRLVAHLVNRAYRGDSARLGWTHEADLLAGTRVDVSLLEEEFQRGVTYVLGWIDDMLVACYHFEQKSKQVAYVGMITVEPTLQAAGLGKRLIEDAISRSKSLGCAQLSLTVMEDRKELIAYYQRRGFSLTGAGEDFNPQDTRYGIPKKELRLIEMSRVL